MDRFLRDLMAMRPLPAHEERTLARRAREGDLEARGELIIAGMRAVVMRAILLGLRGEELRDAVQSGAVGLIRAVDRFDPDRGARLATYAWRWIGAEMRRIERPEVPLGSLEPIVEGFEVSAADLLDGLSEEGAEVLRMRYGIGDFNGFEMSRPAIAARLGISASRVRTIEEQAVRQVRQRLARVLYCVPPQGGTHPQ
ncbi:sigma factor-like helix-turn-helix DNA-binding protein [Aeromicrobium sp. P5_D10]